MKKMISRRNFLKVAGASAAALGLAACGGSSSSTAASTAGSTAASAAPAAAGKVYYLNFKPEQDQAWQDLAAVYTKQTGVPVTVVTAASGQYETTLMSEMEKSEAPTLFQVNGPVGLANWKDYCLDLSGSDVYGQLTSDSFALKDGDAVTSIAYVIETYGIIYNKKIINDYASKNYAVIKSADDIKDYKTLKAVAESINEHKDDLGVDGAFATPGLDASDTYRFSAHMGRIPLYYEYKDMNTTFSKAIKGTYLDNYKDLFDLELETSPTDPSLVSSKTYDDVTSEFALGQVAFYPNGVWAYTQIKGNEVADDDLGMLPYYMGIKGEEESGPAGVYDASWAVNKNASDKDKQATLDFIKWMVTDDEAKKILSQDMGFSVPFTTFDGDEFQPDNPLTKIARSYAADGKTEVRSFTVPDQQWQDDVAAALIEYAQGTGDWSKVKSAYVDGWATEWNNNEESLGSVPQAQKFDQQG